MAAIFHRSTPMITLTDQQAADICGGTSLVNVNVPINTSITLGGNFATSFALAFGGPATSTINQTAWAGSIQRIRSRIG
jgi:hypothetical protein